MAVINIKRNSTKRGRPSSKVVITAAVLLLLIVGLGIKAYDAKQDDGRHIDLTLEEDFKAEKYYAKKMSDILQVENKRLGKPLSALGSGTLDEPTTKPCTFQRPRPHGTSPQCEISQSAHISVAGTDAKQKFSEASQKLDKLLQKYGWKTDGSDKFDPGKGGVYVKLPAFVSYVTTQLSPSSSVADIPATYYRKESYYSEIGRNATCALSIVVEDPSEAVIMVDMDCSAYFFD